MPTISPVKKLPQSRVQCTVTASPEEVTKAEAAAIAKLGANVSIPGFRPGKAPADQVRGQIREEALLEETVRNLLPQAIESILKDGQVRPILPPRVDIQTREPLTLQLTFVERPAVKMKEIDTKAFKKSEPKFDEKDIDRMVQYMLEQYKTTSPVERAAAMGDQVTMDFVGTDEAGKEIQGTRATGYQIVVGSKQLLPGFEDALVNMKKGDQKTIKLTFPEKYHAEHLQNKPVNFAITVHGVESVSMPTLTPEFVKEKQLGDSPEDVRKRIADSMRQQEEEMDRQRREQALFDAIRKATQVDIAPELIDEEERALLEDLSRQLEQQKQSFEEWMTRTKKTPESLRKELREESERRITLRFGVQQLLEDKKIELTPDDEKAAIDARLSQIPNEQRLQAAQYYAKGGDGHDELVWTKKVEKLVTGLLA